MITFQIHTGAIRKDGVLVGSGYAGAPGFVNDPSATALKAKGPLPVGIYKIGPSEAQHQSLGIFVLPLEPQPGNEMFGRGDFYFHGANAAKDLDGQQASSEGCIVTDHDTRVLIDQDADHMLAVVA